MPIPLRKEVRFLNSIKIFVQWFFILLIFHPQPLSGQLVNTLAGGSFADSVFRMDAPVFNMTGMEFDAQGNLFITNDVPWIVQKVDAASGKICRIAGNNMWGHDANNKPALESLFNIPFGVALDDSGNIYISERYASRIWKISKSNGIVTAYAGNGTIGSSGDGGLALNANLNMPQGLAFDAQMNLYLADESNHRIRKISRSTGIITTVAGNGTSGFSGDGSPAVNASLSAPADVAIDGAGNIYIADAGNKRIRRVDHLTGNISTIAGNGNYGGTGDNGPAVNATFMAPVELVCDTAGDVFLADFEDNRVRRIDVSSGIIRAFAGTGSYGYSGDGGLAVTAAMARPSALAFDKDWNLNIADFANRRIRKVEASTGTISTYAGTGKFGWGNNIPARKAVFSGPWGVVPDNKGNMFIADESGQRICKLDLATELLTEIAGDGSQGYNGDGIQALTARLNGPTGLALDTAGNLFIADKYNHRIRKLNLATGIISTIAGTGASGFSGDSSLATIAKLSQPAFLAFDKDWNLLIADKDNHRIRKINMQTGKIYTVAGNGVAGYQGDGGPGIQASLNSPHGIVVDNNNQLYISDRNNHVIRKWDPVSKTISTIAGNGTAGFSGDGGPASTAQLNLPAGVALDRDGNLLIADYQNNRMRKVDLQSGIISTLAGFGGRIYPRENILAYETMLDQVAGVSVDTSGIIYYSQLGFEWVRKLDLHAQAINFPDITGVSYGVNPIPLLATATSGLPVSYSISDTSIARIRNDSLIIIEMGTFGITAFQTGNGYFKPALPVMKNLTVGLGVQDIKFDPLPYKTLGDGPFSLYATPGGSGNPLVFSSSDTNIVKITGISATIRNTGSVTITVNQAGSGKYLPATPVSRSLVIIAPNVMNEFKGTITSIAGGYIGDGAIATSATLMTPGRMCFTADSNLLVSDEGNYRIRKIDLTAETISSITPAQGSYGKFLENALTDTLMFSPFSLRVEPNGNLIGYSWGRIFQWNKATNRITTLAGNGINDYKGDGGNAKLASFSYVYDFEKDALGNLYLADSWNFRIRKIDAATGIISTIAGTGIQGYSGDGNLAVNAQISGSYGICFDPAGNLLFADYYNHCIRKIDLSAGIITTIAGGNGIGFSGDGNLATSCQFKYPTDIVCDASGNLFIADQGNFRIRKIDASTGIITTIGGGGNLISTNIPANQFQFKGIYYLLLDNKGMLYFSDKTGYCVGKINPANSLLTILAGNFTPGYLSASQPSNQSGLAYPFSLCSDPGGDIVISERKNYRVRKLKTQTQILSLAGGNGNTKYFGDGGRADTSGLYPGKTITDKLGNIFIADNFNYKILKIDASTGLISTIAGIGISGYTGDGGPATAARIAYTDGMAFDTTGNLYLTHRNPSLVRKIDKATGVITTIAGTTTRGFNGDNQPALTAQLNYPYGIVIDKEGNLFINDRYNHRIRRIDAGTGIITTIAGTGTDGIPGHGTPALSSNITYPMDLAIDGENNLYFTAGTTYKVFRISKTTGLLTVIAGIGEYGYSGDSSFATKARISPAGIAIDPGGDLLITDDFGHRVRRVQIMGTQKIDFQLTSPRFYKDTVIQLPAFSDAGLPVSYQVSDTGIVRLVGSSIRILKPGTVQITARQAGNSSCKPATDVIRLLQINQIPQVILFDPLPAKDFESPPFDLILSGGASGIPVILSVSDTSIVKITGKRVTIKKTGTVTITASQPGNTYYQPASPVARTLIVSKAKQSIQFRFLLPVQYGEPDFPLTATASSGLPVSYTTSVPSVASLSGSTLSIKGPGTSIIKASQAGNANYLPAPDVLRELLVLEPEPFNGTIKGYVTDSAEIPLRKGTVYLYRLREAQPALPIDSTVLDSTGVFYYFGLDTATYLVLAVPPPDTLRQFIPTYSGNTSLWSDALWFTITNSDTLSIVSIRVKELVKLSGNATIEGKVVMSAKKSRGIRKATEMVTGNPVKSAGVILIGRSKSGNVIARTMTDENGYFRFMDIPPGNYDILVDIPGIEIMSFHSVEISETDTVISEMNYTVSDVGIVSETWIHSPESRKWKIYPNPASDNIYVWIETGKEKAILTLMDIQGKIMQVKEILPDAPQSSLELDVSNLDPGIYLLVLKTSEGRGIRKLIIK
ncbi:MAG: T9SS type A sorting domain-containing protein [Bacteroidales bacterium]